MRARRCLIAVSCASLIAACNPDASPESAPAASGPGGAGGAEPAVTPIRHVVVILRENHTFDNYFGSFPGAEGITRCDVGDGIIPCPRAPDHTRDLCHTRDCLLTEWNGGGMDGWASVGGTSKDGDHLAWAQYDEHTIPAYWAYARTFTLADHFFAGAIGPSFPGHMFVLAAQAGWATGNPAATPASPYWGCDGAPTALVPVVDQASCTESATRPCFSIPSVPDVLPSGVTWKFYGSTVEQFTEVFSALDAIEPIRRGPGWANVVRLDQLAADISAHALPNVAWIVDMGHDNEHPQWGSICRGENAAVEIVDRIMNSEYWAETAIFITTDDPGGWYDHVPPPRKVGCDGTYGLGFRLPLLIVSPWARPGYVFEEVAEHASIPRFIERVFGAPPLSTLDPAAQDGQANDLFHAFDWGQAPLPPLVLAPRNCP